MISHGVRADPARMAADALAAARARRLQFGRYVLDRDRGCLLADGSEVPLRPKTFAVLDYLAENSGRLVSKDELFAAVWPNLAVSDDTLVQSIGELRRALGGDGLQLIRTAPRRGYLFDPKALPQTPPLESALASAAQPPQPLADPIAPPRMDAHRRVVWRRGGLAAIVLLVVLVAAEMRGEGARRLFGPTERAAIYVPALTEKPAIAVLPLSNESGDPARNYLVDGLTQDLIGALGRFSELTVMSWNAVQPYRAKPAIPEAVARALGVRYQVEGDARQVGDRMRVDARLVGADGRVLWSSHFDERLADLIALPDEMTAQIAGRLAIRVTEAEQRRAFAKPTDSLEAYGLVLRARPALQRPERASVAAARPLLRRAIELDPNYAAAYSALAETYYIAVSMGWADPPIRFLRHAQEAATKALNIDDSDVSAHITLGRIDIFYHRFGEALAEMDQAIAINPNDAHALAGRGNALMWIGQTDKAIAALEAAQHLDPDLGPLDRFALSLAYYLNKRYDAAIEQAQINLRKTAGANFSRIILAVACAEADRSEDAARTVSEIRRLDPTFDAQQFGSKFLSPVDLKNLREGLRKAGLLSDPAAVKPPAG